jgi:hypothetical protein
MEHEDKILKRFGFQAKTCEKVDSARTAIVIASRHICSTSTGGSRPAGGGLVRHTAAVRKGDTPRSLMSVER